MKVTDIRKIIDLRILLLTCVLLLTLGAKYYLANAPLEQLKFLLLPLSFAVELFYSTFSVFSTEHGYIFPELAMHIDRSCSGINFLVLLLCSASSYVLFRVERTKWVTLLAVIFLLTYPVASLVNMIRIILLVYVQPFNSNMSAHLQSILHEGIGAFCFFGFLVALFVFAESKIVSTRTNLQILKSNV